MYKAQGWGSAGEVAINFPNAEIRDKFLKYMGKKLVVVGLQMLYTSSGRSGRRAYLLVVQTYPMMI